MILEQGVVQEQLVQRLGAKDFRIRSEGTLKKCPALILDAQTFLFCISAGHLISLFDCSTYGFGLLGWQITVARKMRFP